LEFTTVIKDVPNNQLQFNMQYANDIFDDNTIYTLSLRMIQFIEHIFSDTTKPICYIPFLLEDENQIIHKMNDTDFNFKQSQSIHSIIINKCQNILDKAAIVFDNIVLTYRILINEAYQTAYLLINNYNVQLGDIVTLDYKDSDGLELVTADSTRFVVYNIAYSRGQDGPSMTIYLSEV
jgi:hypothetical protein